VRLPHVLLGLFIAAIWGTSFVAIKIGLQSYPPLMLAALRFTVAASPALVIGRPVELSWGHLVATGATLLLGQSGFLFVAIKVGMPPGLASVVIQAQAFITMAIAYVALGEVPRRRQIMGALIASAGLCAIAFSITAPSTGNPLLGFFFILVGATSWAAGNVLVRRSPKAEMLPTMIWLSTICVAPLFLLSFYFEGQSGLFSLMHPTAIGVAAVGYLAAIVTVLGFGLWGYLLKLYPAGTVAPFAIAVPVFGVSASAATFGERFGYLDFLGMALVLGGLFLIARSPRSLRPN